MRAFKRIERAIKHTRDRVLVKPLARSRLVQRHAHFGYDYAVKRMSDHLIAFDPRGGQISRHLMEKGDWHRDDFRRVLEQLHGANRETRGRVFLDIGANIGTQTIYALAQNDFDRAVSIEPMPPNQDVLDLNVTLNRLQDRVAVVRRAAGKVAGTALLAISPSGTGEHSLHARFVAERAHSIPVDVEPIDSILARLAVPPAQIGLMWIDVEGFEPEVIAGAESLIQASAPIFMEFNSDVYGEAQTKALLEHLSGHYRAVFSPGRGDLPPASFEVEQIDGRYMPGDLLFL